jgi:hypothetical protein
MNKLLEGGVSFFLEVSLQCITIVPLYTLFSSRRVPLGLKFWDWRVIVFSQLDVVLLVYNYHDSFVVEIILTVKLSVFLSFSCIHYCDIVNPYHLHIYIHLFSVGNSSNYSVGSPVIYTLCKIC